MNKRLLTTKAKQVIDRLEKGHQPLVDTPKWILEGLEQADFIYWGVTDHAFGVPWNGWKLTNTD